MSSLYILETATLFLGDDDKDNKKNLSLMNLKLPDLEEVSQVHHGGGAIGAIKIAGLGFKELECTFKLAGLDPQSMRHFSLRQHDNYTVRGLVRSKSVSVRSIPIRATLYGRLTKVAPGEFKRGELFEQDYAIDEITRYQLFYDNKEMYFYDYLNTEWRIDGVTQNAEERWALGLD